MVADEGVEVSASSHGSRVATIAVGAPTAASRVVASAPRLLDVRVQSSHQPATPEAVARAIEAATGSGADLIVVARSTSIDLPRLRRAVTNADRNGSLVISSLRNEVVGSASYPADYPTVLSVSSTDASDQRSPPSPRNGDVSALGMDVQVIGPGSSAVSLSGTSIAVASAARAILRCTAPGTSRPQVLEFARISGLEDNRGTPVLRCGKEENR